MTGNFSENGTVRVLMFPNGGPAQPMETQTKSVPEEVAKLLAKRKELVERAETLLIEKNGQKYPPDE